MSSYDRALTRATNTLRRRAAGLVALLRRLLLEDGYDVTTRVHPLPEGELELVLLLERLDGA